MSCLFSGGEMERWLRIYCQGNTLYSRQCTRCKHTDSPTSGTLFHKVKFPLLKVFYIVYFVSTNKKGIASTELSRKLGLRQKTCWYFKRKVMKAMESSGKYLLAANVGIGLRLDLSFFVIRLDYAIKIHDPAQQNNTWTFYNWHKFKDFSADGAIVLGIGYAF